MLLDKDIKTLHEMLKNKQITVLDLLNESLKNYENNKINSFNNIYDESHLKNKAKNITNFDHILSGIPFGLKDLINTNDLISSGSSKILENFIPSYNAHVTNELLKTNSLLIGKNNCDEFGAGDANYNSNFGRVLNPHNENKITGGSSGGSAAAIAANIVKYSIGTDTGGSIRQPSSFCGITGLKPTYGLISRNGVMPLANSLDTVGPMTKNILDNAYVLEAMNQNYDEFDGTHSKKHVKKAYSLLIKEPINNKNIIIPKNLYDKLDKKIKEKFDNLITKLENNGFKINFKEIKSLNYATAIYYTINCAEAFSNYSRYDSIRYGLKSKKSDFETQSKNSRALYLGDEVKARMLIGAYILESSRVDKWYTKAQKLRSELKNELKDLISENGYIMFPATNSIAFDYKQNENNDLNKTKESSELFDGALMLANLSGMPSLTTKMADINDMPIGVNIMADFFKEEELYKLGLIIEKGQGK